MSSHLTQAAVNVGSRRVLALRLGRGVAAVAGLAVLVGSVGCSWTGGGSNSSSIDVPLEYKPRDTDPVPAVRVPANAGVKVQIGDTDDKRDESERRSIGRNNEDKTSIPVYGTGGSVAGFVNKVIQQQVKSARLTVTDDMAVVTRRLASELLTFQVTEASSYQGEVQVNFKVVDNTGKTLFERAYTGTAGNHGKSKSAENYQETFSDATKKAVVQLLVDPDFAAALVDEQQK